MDERQSADAHEFCLKEEQSYTRRYIGQQYLQPYRLVMIAIGVNMKDRGQVFLKTVLKANKMASCRSTPKNPHTFRSSICSSLTNKSGNVGKSGNRCFFVGFCGFTSAAGSSGGPSGETPSVACAPFVVTTGTGVAVGWKLSTVSVDPSSFEGTRTTSASSDQPSTRSPPPI